MKIRPTKILIKLAFCFIILIAHITAHSIAKADLLPHQAHYSLSMNSLNMPGMSISHGGDFYIRLEKSCNSWVVASQFSFNLESDDGVPVNMVMLNQWEETLDGQSMSFLSQTIINGTVVKFYEGVANHGKGDKKGQLHLTQPTQSTHDLPPNIYFPVSATKKSLENITKGQIVQNYTLYDGATEQAVRVSDLLAGKAALPDSLPENAKAYLKGEGWKIVSSFFDLTENDSEATATHVANIYENGVTARLKISNPQLSATGTLKQFEALDSASCSTSN